MRWAGTRISAWAPRALGAGEELAGIYLAGRAPGMIYGNTPANGRRVVYGGKDGSVRGISGRAENRRSRRSVPREWRAAAAGAEETRAAFRAAFRLRGTLGCGPRRQWRIRPPSVADSSPVGDGFGPRRNGFAPPLPCGGFARRQTAPFRKHAGA
jgi:hypothetical protein